MAIDKKSYLERKFAAAHRVTPESLDRETGMRAADLQADGARDDVGAGSSINNGLNYGSEEEQGGAGEGPEDGGGGGVLPQEGFADGQGVGVAGEAEGGGPEGAGVAGLQGAGARGAVGAEASGEVYRVNKQVQYYE